MRTSVSLDQDVYELVTIYAKGRDITLGAAIGELVRKTVEGSTPESPSPRLMRGANGLLIARPQGRTISNEMVRQAMEEDD
jgi:hypothetical protein